ncbi:hypothetical protein GCM10010129_41110 [Streptomyces fumigatiscleroticus]|nr:hypothetical protein GCM10010129_41110 [Streptomyces fumigatiscleroticus]
MIDTVSLGGTGRHTHQRLPAPGAAGGEGVDGPVALPEQGEAAVSWERCHRYMAASSARAAGAGITGRRQADRSATVQDRLGPPDIPRPAGIAGSNPWTPAR